MKKYSIIVSSDAKTDLDDLYDFITMEYKSLSTAKKYSAGLRKAIKSLERTAGSFQVQSRSSLLQYGSNVRRVNYKRMAVIYTIHGDIVYIHRIVPATMITGL